MILDACRWLEVSPGHALFIGDRLTDLQAASHAGCQTALVRTGHGSQTENELGDTGHAVFDDLLQAVDYLRRPQAV